jgi:hypothetical protein
MHTITVFNLRSVMCLHGVARDSESDREPSAHDNVHGDRRDQRVLGLV